MFRAAISAAACFISTGAAAGLINADFSDPTLGTADTITQAQADTGWYARAGTWSIVAGEAHRNSQSSQRNNTERGIAQIFTGPELQGTGVFAFDYAVTDPPAFGALPLSFWLVGYTGAGSMDTDEDIDTFLILTNMPMSGTSYSVDVLLQDSLSFADGTFTGTYEDESIAFGAGYDYFGIAFSTGRNQDGWSVNLDNVVVAAPAPASLGLMLTGVAGLAWKVRRRRVLSRRWGNAD
jgi:hypothetical protein